jgi:Capsular polysaccharide synthesis protein
MPLLPNLIISDQLYQHTIMDVQNYPIPSGVHAIPSHLLDLGPDSEIDKVLLHPRAVSDEKNIWFFWHSGFTHMHPYTQRNVRAWHRRFSKHGWTIRVLDRLPSSPLNVANFLDTSDPDTFPRAFVDGTIGGDYAPQHTSDLVRWPLLLKFGGIYADVGLMQIGDLDRLWNQTVGNSTSRFEILTYNAGPVEERSLTNYFLCSGRNNALFARCHKLFLQLWAADGGKTSTEEMHASPLLKGVPLLGQRDSLAFEEDGKKFGPEEVRKMLSDYITQGQVMTMVMGLVDEEGNWNGPRYVAEHIYAVDYMVGSQLINVLTAWNGPRAFKLMSLSLPKSGEQESEDQKQARKIVEGCLQKSFGFKLAHGLILRVMGDTLGSLWRKHDGSDNVPGTYAHWLRHGTKYWTQNDVPPTLDFQVIEPYRRGPLLRPE